MTIGDRVDNHHKLVERRTKINGANSWGSTEGRVRTGAGVESGPHESLTMQPGGCRITEPVGMVRAYAPVERETMQPTEKAQSNAGAPF